MRKMEITYIHYDRQKEILSDSLYKNLQLMIMGEISPDDVINESVSYAETILNE